MNTGHEAESTMVKNSRRGAKLMRPETCSALSNFKTLGKLFKMFLDPECHNSTYIPQSTVVRITKDNISKTASTR